MYYESWLAHFNPNHDPNTGRFVKGNTIRSNRSVNPIIDIYSSLPKEEKKLLSPHDEIYSTDKDYKNGNVAKSFVMYDVSGIPISFFDVWRDSKVEGRVGIGIATRSGNDYRGRGYAGEVAKRGMEWLKKQNDISKVNWMVRKDNYRSIKLAKKLGFHYLGATIADDNWVLYTKEYKRGIDTMRSFGVLV